MKPETVSALFPRRERHQNSVLSVYLNVDQSQQINLNRGFETQLKEMASRLRASLTDDVQRETFEIALQSMENFISTYSPAGRGLVLFFDSADRFFHHEELQFPVTNKIRWNHELFLQPLASALDQLEDYGVVLADRTKVRVFLVQLGKIEELVNKEISGKRVRHVKSTGNSHAESSSRMQRRADNQVRSNLQHVVLEVDQFVKTSKVHRLVLAGTPEIAAELRQLLPARLALSVIGDTPLAMDASLEHVLSAVNPIAERFERDSEIQKVEAVVTAARKKGEAVIGLGHTLQAVNSGRVWELLYSCDFLSPGFECAECSALFSAETPACPHCGSKLEPVRNVVERAVEHAFRKRAKIEVVTGEASAALDTAGGIGAFLKTRTGTAQL